MAAISEQAIKNNFVRFPVSDAESSYGSHDQHVERNRYGGLTASSDGILQRRRPLSADLGIKAKGAVMDLGRAARGLYQLRHSTRYEDQHKLDANGGLVITPSMNDIDNLIPTLSPPQSPLAKNQERLKALEATTERLLGLKSGPASTHNYVKDVNIGLGLEGLSRVPALVYNDESYYDRAAVQEGALLNRNVVSDRHIAAQPRRLQEDESLFAGPNKFAGRALNLDRVEITLEDVESDSPIFRAALQSVEKRTLLLKRAAKTICKAAEDSILAIAALDAAEERVNQSLKTVSGLMPSTLGILHQSTVEDIQSDMHCKRLAARKELETHVLAPMKCIYEVCKALSAQFKTFEADSKSYYAATQKFLSSRTPAVNRLETAQEQEIYSSEAVGFDKANAKQERQDERQRIRQALFDLSRLNIYQSMCRVHAGEAEVLLASHLVSWCSSHSSNKQAKDSLQPFVDNLLSSEIRVREQSRAAENRCIQIKEDIRQLHISTRQDGVDVPESGSDEDSKTFLIEHKLEALRHLSGLSSVQAQCEILGAVSCPLPHSASFTAETDQCEDMTASLSYEGSAKQSNAEFGTIPTLSDAPSSARKWQARLRSFSFSKQNQDRSDVCNARLSLNESRSPRLERPTSQQRRSLSFTSANSTPVIKRQSAGKTTLEQRPDEEKEKRSSKPPVKAVAHDKASRKREGILWVMTKPIQGLSGGDTPRAVTKSTNWHECWVVLSGSGHLSEYANWKEAGCPSAFEPLKPMIDLRFATVREARNVERRFTFEVVTREQRHFFQAPNEAEMLTWMTAIGLAIESLINGTSSVRHVERVVRNAGDAKKADAVPTQDSAVRRMFDGTSSSTNDHGALGIRAAFSQSLTDLSSSTAAKLFMRNSRDGGARTRNGKHDGKHDGKNFEPCQSKHLAALSEGGQTTDESHDTMMKDRGTRLSVSQEEEDLAFEDESKSSHARHSRGISNTTPLSGYIARGHGGEHLAVHGKDWSASQLASTSCLNISTDFDRRIEMIVNNSYGQPSPMESSSCYTSSGFNSRIDDTALTSISPSRNASSNGNTNTGSKHFAEGSNKYSRAQEILAIASLEGNNRCADCLSPDPRWASWSLNGEHVCIFICITCSGAHRSLGVQVSKVRSVDLDDWTEEQLAAARRWGNDRANDMYERRKPDVCTVESMGGTRTKAFWLAKYVNQLWFEDARETIPNERVSMPSSSNLEMAKYRPSSGAGAMPARRTVERMTIPLQVSNLANR